MSDQALNIPPVATQLPLILVVNDDDKILSNTPNAEWFNILNKFNYVDYVFLGAAYYDALYDYNKQNKTKSNSNDYKIETKDEAKKRLLENRPTMDKSKPVLHEQAFIVPIQKITSPLSISPGIVPEKFAGKKPKCFFSLFKAFIGVTLMGIPATPDMVYQNLTSNPAFARACGFNPNCLFANNFMSVPSHRKIQQFDMIMERYGIWSTAKYIEVAKNIESGVVKMEDTLVGDTTHYLAYAEFEVVKIKDEAGKEIKKSQSKVTKNCRCENRETCKHEYVLTDEGAGTIVKSGKKMYFGHKASVVGFPEQGIPLDAKAVADGATYDGQTFFPHIQDLFENLPIVQPFIKTVLYDSACDDKDLKKNFKDELKINLKASLNPRRIKAIEKDLPKGMKKLTPYGELICNEGHELDYQGVRFDSETFIYEAPKTENDEPFCNTCALKDNCCPKAANGRVVNIPFYLLPHIDETDPPMAKRFKALMTKRPSVERMIKRLKCDLGDDKLTKRGNSSFQASLDKTLIAFHILIRN